MDYKVLFKNQETRIKLLQFLSFIPDATMLKVQYRMKLGRKLNLKNPKRYSEKIQLYKLMDRDPVMEMCADKYSVRSFVEQRIGAQYLNTLYGVYNEVDDIDFNKLPNQFVLKDTLGSSGDLSMILVTDKSKLDLDWAKTKMQKWVDEPINKKNAGREWVYDGRRHRIIAEKLLISDEKGDLPDYKFFCFDGKVACSYMMMNYTMHHEKGILGFFDRDFNLLPVRRADFAPMLEQPQKPINYDKMVELAEALASGFKHARVDFYNIKGQIVFGEITFFNASGYVKFEPDEFDYTLGNLFKI